MVLEQMKKSEVLTKDLFLRVIKKIGNRNWDTELSKARVRKS